VSDSRLAKDRTVPTTADYTVELEAFHGPLDLLLFLIRRAEVDVSEISVASITDQFLRFIEQLDDIDVDAAGEFLVIAATLIELKARLLSPMEPEGARPSGERESSGREPVNPAADLVRQLLRYKQFRDAAEALDDRRTTWESRSPLRPLGLPGGALPRADDSSELEDLSLYDLVTAYGRIGSTVQFDRLGAHKVEADDTPIELHAADIVDRLKRSELERDGTKLMPLVTVFDARPKSDVIGLFLAVLELVRQGVVRVSMCPESSRVELVLLSADESPAEPVAWDDDGPLDEDPDDEEDELESGRFAAYE